MNMHKNLQMVPANTCSNSSTKAEAPHQMLKKDSLAKESTPGRGGGEIIKGLNYEFLRRSRQGESMYLLEGRGRKNLDYKLFER